MVIATVSTTGRYARVESAACLSPTLVLLGYGLCRRPTKDNTSRHVTPNAEQTWREHPDDFLPKPHRRSRQVRATPSPFTVSFSPMKPPKPNATHATRSMSSINLTAWHIQFSSKSKPRPADGYRKLPQAFPGPIGHSSRDAPSTYTVRP
jgi:hypothetical protein